MASTKPIQAPVVVWQSHSEGSEAVKPRTQLAQRAPHDPISLSLATDHVQVVRSRSISLHRVSASVHNSVTLEQQRQYRLHEITKHVLLRAYFLVKRKSLVGILKFPRFVYKISPRDCFPSR